MAVTVVPVHRQKRRYRGRWRRSARTARTSALALAASATLAAIVVGGCGGHSPTGNAATVRAPLANPRGVAVTRDGTVYIADTGNDRVRRVSPAGVMTTVAGDGHRGFSGDNGPATAAELNGPAGVAMAGDGNLYIADEFNHRVRRVSPAGLITTVAGDGQGGFRGENGPATAAELRDPIGVATAADGSLYIADTGNDRVLRVNPAGVIAIVAGDGRIGFSGERGLATAAHLSDPVGVAVAVDGSAYIADQDNNLIRAVSPAGVITTVAGDQLFGFSGENGTATASPLNVPAGVALAADGSFYLADQDNDRIRRVSPAGVITTVAGDGQRGFSGENGPATAAELDRPSGVAVGADGSLYIADTGNDRIRRVSPAGVITTVAG